MTEVEVAIRAFQDGDNGAFDVIHQTYKQRLWAYLCSRVGCHEDAQDLFNTVSLQVARDINRLRHCDRLISWVLGIASHRVLDHYRKRKKTNVPFDPTSFAIVDPAPTSEKQLLGNEKLRHLLRCLERLSEPQKELFQLQYLAGVPQKDIAFTRKLNLNVLKSHVFRAKTKIIHCMRRRGFYANTCSRQDVPGLSSE